MRALRWTRGRRLFDLGHMIKLDMGAHRATAWDNLGWGQA